MIETREGRPLRDERLAAILGVAAVFLGCVAVSAWVADAMAEAAPPRPPMTGPVPRAVAASFPAPRLQPAPAADLIEVRKASDRMLDGWAWVDREAGTVRVPIGVAIDALVQSDRRLGEEDR